MRRVWLWWKVRWIWWLFRYVSSLLARLDRLWNVANARYVRMIKCRYLKRWTRNADPCPACLLPSIEFGRDWWIFGRVREHRSRTGPWRRDPRGRLVAWFWSRRGPWEDRRFWIWARCRRWVRFWLWVREWGIGPLDIQCLVWDLKEDKLGTLYNFSSDCGVKYFSLFNPFFFNILYN